MPESSAAAPSAAASTTSAQVPDARRWRAAGLALLAALSAVVLLTYRDFGLTWDEDVHRTYGDAVIAWFTSGFRERSALDFLATFLSTGTFDVVAQLAVRISPAGPYETRHLLGGLVGVVGVLATYRLAALVAGARAGVFSAVLLALTPAYFGHSFNNPKDVPLAVAVVVALLYIVRAGRESPRIRWSLALGAGAAMGVALGVRVQSAFLLGLAALHWIAPVALARGVAPGERARTLRAALARLAGATAIAWAAMLVLWPWAQLGPFTRPFEALAYGARFDWNGPVLFDGAMMPAASLPRSYLPVWFAISLPEIYFLALACAAVLAALALARREAWSASRLRELGLLAIAAFGPVAAAIVLRARNYDAQRHFLFVLPPLAVLCGIALSRFVDAAAIPRWARGAVVVAGIASLLLTLGDMIQLHPYQTVYFNRLVGGGLASGAERFETDYWGASYREGIEDVVRHYVPFRGGRVVKVANCSVPFLTGYWLERNPNPAFRNVEPWDEPDLFLATTRLNCHAHRPGTFLHAVRRQGVPLMWVIELNRRGVWVE